jgi:hypothetical protein
MTSHRRLLSTAGCLLALSVAGCGNASTSASSAAPASPGTAMPVSAAASSAAASSAAPASAAQSSAAPATTATRTAGLDIDGDGLADAMITRFVGAHSAIVWVRLGNGKTVHSKAFRLFPGDGAGAISGFDVNGDRRAEVFVSAPGADGVGYDLFSYVGSSLVAVPPPHGQESPYLYIGGGIYYGSSFGCSDDALVQVKEAPAVVGTASLPPDPPFLVTTTTYVLAEGVLSVRSTHTVHVADRAAAQALLRQPAGGCGTAP